MNKKKVLTTLCIVASSFVFAQEQDNNQSVTLLDEVTITDSRFELKRENSGKTVVKISDEELQQHADKTVAQIINTKSGINIVGSNSQAGQPLTTSVRGGQNRQVLVLIDGVAVNDASLIENNFDLQLLSLSQIEEIEILKGASSALYGNRASTAVINITLKKAKKGSVNATFSSFLGTNKAANDSNFAIEDFTNSVGINGRANNFNYLVNFSNRFTDGLSAVREIEGAEANDSDRFSKINTNVKLGYDFSEHFVLNTMFSHDKYNTQYDGGFFFIDENNVSKNEQLRVSVSPKYSYNNGSVTVNAALTTVDREFQSDFPATFDAKTLSVDAFNKYAFSDKLYTVLGVNVVKNEMNNPSPFSPIMADEANDQIVDPYASVTYLTDFGFNLNAGLRLNNHSEYGSNIVYNINPSYVFKLKENASLKLLASYSTAYVTPSLYQLFVPGFGNANLEAQEDTTIEAGLGFALHDNLRLSAVYFNRNQDNYIDYVTTDFVTFAGEYQNINEDFKVQGVEVELSYKPIASLDFNANYTFTERQDNIIFRVPKQKVNASLGYQICQSTNANISYQFNSDRVSPFFEDDFVTNRTLESYSLVNLSLNHNVLNNKMTLFVSVNNLFDEDYEELYRFSTLGRNFKFGFQLNL
ncbi:TonB-dependent receptor [Olleya sp. YS]|uniref:TonB-dependent receptor plug domain-containing protein n=1 Tax=Olleya sp. YS TaxID=3028318 RepID=UPI0024344030|nr:TonB-dependent receptor [Olleya sp. YS]WGD34940.1 TonB-dependent receptor [Olleya sp. YS]